MTNLAFDKIETLKDGTIIQHGRYNDRIYLMQRGDLPTQELICKMKELADKSQYSKIIAKSSADDLPLFIEHGFTVEARIPSFYCGKQDLFMMGYYLKTERAYESNISEFEQVLSLAQSKADSANSSNVNFETLTIRACKPEDVSQMAAIYREVFPTYPFPIHEANYLRKTMDEHIDYYCIEADGKILTLSAAEIDDASKSAEMTDFATLPENQGKGFATALLSFMEKESAQKGIQTYYTIARAISAGMNITFARHGYQYAGRLKNNTHISGNIESMNVWYKNALTTAK